MISLPIDAYLPEIAEALRGSQNLVLVAPPGAGKTTRVPPAILGAGLASKEHPNVLMLQPRRVAARASAERIAEENGWELGREVGYHIRFEKRISEKTRLRVLTEGILTRQLLEDPFLEGVGVVVLDEFHERSLHSDLCVALLREVQQTVRADLKIVVMSATLEAEGIAEFLKAPIVRTEGRVFPVEVGYRPLGDSRLEVHVGRLVEEALDSEAGDVLVFLPGVGEIERTRGAMAGLVAKGGVLVLPLHGSLSSEEQRWALLPAGAGKRKVILATNIAETSLTIEGVRTVIDSGLARVAGFDAERGMDRLDLKRISKASAVQRAGRAGRTAPGRCWRLWSSAEDKNLEAFETPEILRVDLAPTVLALHAWGSRDAREFGWFERPAEGMLAAAEDLLDLLGATHGGSITDIGKQMVGLPTHPRLGRLLIEAGRWGLVREGATIAALLSEKDILRRGGDGFSRGPRMKADSDLEIRLEVLKRNAPEAGDVDGFAVSQVLRVRDELMRMGERLEVKGAGRKGEEFVKRLPLFAYPDRVVRRRGTDAMRGVMVGGGGVRLAPESGVLEPELFLALVLRRDDRSVLREAQVTMAAGVEREWLEMYFPHAVSREVEAVFEEERQRVVGILRERYRDLVLREDANSPVDAEVAGRELGRVLGGRAEALFRGDEASVRLLARVALLREYMPEKGWPVFDGGMMKAIVEEACVGRRSLAEASAGGLVQLLKNFLVYPLDRVLEEEAPETVEVPTGNRIKVEYAEGQNPVLAVRLQELFGWTDTPRIAGGRVALTLHLLAPNYRPAQVTSDLRSFWKSAYFEVRKDLRARYPKHSWPEDPLTAEAVARGRRRG